MPTTHTMLNCRMLYSTAALAQRPSALRGCAVRVIRRRRPRVQCPLTLCQHHRSRLRQVFSARACQGAAPTCSRSRCSQYQCHPAHSSRRRCVVCAGLWHGRGVVCTARVAKASPESRHWDRRASALHAADIMELLSDEDHAADGGVHICTALVGAEPYTGRGVL